MDASAGITENSSRSPADNPLAVVTSGEEQTASPPSQTPLLQPTAAGYIIPAVAGKKRTQGGRDAHDLDNTKAQKTAQNVRPPNPLFIVHN